MNRFNLSVFIIFITSFILGGCGQQENKTQSNFPVKTVVKKYHKTTILTGTVNNNAGPIDSATIEVTNDQGNVIVSTQLQQGGRYSVEIPAGTELPIILTATIKADASSAQQLTAAVIDPGLKRYDINELTTAIAKKAKSMGGYSYENMSQAAMTSTATPDTNKTTGGFRGDPTSQYGGWH